jgi:hypothetical protein
MRKPGPQAGPRIVECSLRTHSGTALLIAPSEPLFCKHTSSVSPNSHKLALTKQSKPISMNRSVLRHQRAAVSRRPTARCVRAVRSPATRSHNTSNKDVPERSRGLHLYVGAFYLIFSARATQKAVRSQPFDYNRAPHPTKMRDCTCEMDRLDNP